ncbi:hypothetical protein COV16_07100 [Candidatus Woesearchaeota archaeon CG10_big_fil_rev_8_21_14_0_10_34_8]|nr:MAG: hypothetical protein COV16_07100 [Candidatus Woesearchaeota archaeon CG10_big_fil_rev_8_21_14_0_10_34_8]
MARKKTKKKKTANRKTSIKIISTKKRPKIKREADSLKQSFEQQHIIEQKMQHFVSWTAMLLLIFINFLGAILLVPFLLFFEGISQYLIIVLFGVGFGLIFNLMIHSIEHLGDKHHIIAGVIVPIFALLDIIILFGILEKAVKKLEIIISYNYTLIVVIFICAFLIPYLFDIIRRKHKF